MISSQMQRFITALKEIQSTYCVDGNLPALNEKIEALLLESSIEETDQVCEVIKDTPGGFRAAYG